MYDITIVGSGIIGSLSAYEIAKAYPKKKIALLDKNNEGSASYAAGAMLNVYGEIDYGLDDNGYTDRKINLGDESLKLWDEWFKNNSKFKDCKTADETIVFINKKSTELESKTFNRIASKVRENKGEVDLNYKNLKKLSFFKSLRLKNEGALDTKFFFKKLNKHIYDKNNISKILTNVKNITAKKNLYEIKIDNNKKILTKKIILSAGSYSKILAGKLGRNIQDVFFGIGTAFEVRDDKKNFDKIFPKRKVIRTPNRGSTCGLHIVPRLNGEFYIGAGSNISKTPIAFPRIETVNYLLRCFQNEISKDFSKNLFRTVIGYRPMSLDGKPLIGDLKENKNIFFISGTKRDGLTIAPLIIKAILEWIENKKDTLEEKFYDWQPERAPISYINKEYAINAYVQNKLAGIIEHKLINKSVKKIKTELENEAVKMHNKVIKKYNLKNNFGIHPEILNII